LANPGTIVIYHENMYIQRFDPWKSPLCTCPPKYTLNPYTGCGHRCIYCYATSFIKNFYSPRVKKNFLKRCFLELKKLPDNALISLSNSSDPYQPLEKNFFHTREFLKLCLSRNVKILILTKSNLVVRDIELLKKLRCAVSITITSKRWDAKLEPLAPSTKERIEALKSLSKEGIPTIARLDPIIPGVNEKEVLELLEEVSPFVKHITTSTYKAKPDSLKRLAKVFPSLAGFWRELYLEKGERIGGSFYLPKTLREELIYPLFESTKKLGISFATCREGIEELKREGRCDGSFLIP